MESHRKIGQVFANFVREPGFNPTILLLPGKNLGIQEKNGFSKPFRPWRACVAPIRINSSAPRSHGGRADIAPKGPFFCPVGAFGFAEPPFRFPRNFNRDWMTANQVNAWTRGRAAQNMAPRPIASPPAHPQMGSIQMPMQPSNGTLQVKAAPFRPLAQASSSTPPANQPFPPQQGADPWAQAWYEQHQ